MLIELPGVWLCPQQGYTHIQSTEPHECPYCHRMTCFFENRGGHTTCTECPASERTR